LRQASTIKGVDSSEISTRHSKKKQKLETGEAVAVKEDDFCRDIKSLIKAIEHLHEKHSSLFEWIDGPLVTAMKNLIKSVG